jgi:hypothetical protein
MTRYVILKIFASILLLLIVGCGRSEKDWEKANTENTITAYEGFLQKHPRSKFSNEAISRLEKLYRPVDWKKAQAANTIATYEEFLQKHPEGEYADQTRFILNEMYLPRDWEKARSTNTIEAYEEFLKLHPKGNFADEACSLLKPLKYERNFERLAAEERSLPIPHKRSHTMEEVLNMIRQRADLAKKFKQALENDEITKEQYEILMKRNQKHSLGHE